MPEIMLPVDAETVAITALAAGAAGTAAGGKVLGRLPRGFSAGDVAIRVVRIGGVPVDWVGHLDRARLQVDAYDGSDEDAHALAALALVDLLQLRGQTVAGGVVTEVRQDGALRNFPDPDYDAPRYTFGVVLYTHPTAP